MFKDCDINVQMPTDDELTHDETNMPAEMDSLLEPGPHGGSQQAFFQSLKSEIARATRYNFLVCVLVLRMMPSPQLRPLETEVEPTSELTHLLDSALRSTDFLSCLGKGLVGIIVPHSNEDTPWRLLQRLQAESVFSAFQRRTGCDLRAAFSVYPIDATTIPGLFRVAFGRLCYLTE